MSTVFSDQDAVYYDFTDLSVEVEGIALSFYVEGCAELMRDPHDEGFFVASITINGTAPDRLAPATTFGGRPRKAVRHALKRPADKDIGAAACMFRLIASAVESDRDAAEFWQRETAE